MLFMLLNMNLIYFSVPLAKITTLHGKNQQSEYQQHHMNSDENNKCWLGFIMLGMFFFWGLVIGFLLCKLWETL